MALGARAGWLLDLSARVGPDELAPYFPSTVAAATYLLLSTTLRPEFSAVLVGLKLPDRAIAEARHRLGYFLASRR